MFAFGAPSAPVANWGVLGFPEASSSYNFIYSRLPSTAESGPSSPSRATLVPQQRVFCWSEGGGSAGIDRARSAVPTCVSKRTGDVQLGKTLQHRALNVTEFPERH